jgi:hypothetical protein
MRPRLSTTKKKGSFLSVTTFAKRDHSKHISVELKSEQVRGRKSVREREEKVIYATLVIANRMSLFFFFC